MRVIRVKMGKRLIEADQQLPTPSAEPIIVDKRRLAAFERRKRLVERASSFVDLKPKAHEPELIDQDTPELRRSLSRAAALLLPIAQSHVASGKWSPHVSAWLTMVHKKVAPASGANASGAVTNADEGNVNDRDFSC